MQECGLALDRRKVKNSQTGEVERTLLIRAVQGKDKKVYNGRIALLRSFRGLGTFDWLDDDDSYDDDEDDEDVLTDDEDDEEYDEDADEKQEQDGDYEICENESYEQGVDGDDEKEEDGDIKMKSEKGSESCDKRDEEDDESVDTSSCTLSSPIFQFEDLKNSRKAKSTPTLNKTANFDTPYGDIRTRKRKQDEIGNVEENLRAQKFDKPGRTGSNSESFRLTTIGLDLAFEKENILDENRILKEELNVAETGILELKTEIESLNIVIQNLNQKLTQCKCGIDKMDIGDE